MADREALTRGSTREEDVGLDTCRVYWGSHGCYLPRGHDGPHLCTCAHVDDDPSKPLLPHMDDVDDDDAPGAGNVGRPPYYGAHTSFYGEDAVRDGA